MHTLRMKHNIRLTGKTQYRTHTIGFFRTRQVLVLQVEEAYEWYGLGEITGPTYKRWRDATVEEMTRETNDTRKTQ